MKTKKFIFLVFIFALSLTVTGYVFAQQQATTPGTANPSPALVAGDFTTPIVSLERITVEDTPATIDQQTKLTSVINTGLGLINKRVKSLNDLKKQNQCFNNY